LIVAGIIASGLAMVVYFKALKLSQASKVVPITSIYPLFTVIFSALLLGESVSPKVVIGAILIVRSSFGEWRLNGVIQNC